MALNEAVELDSDFDPNVCYSQTACRVGDPGDGVCDFECYVPECNYDNGDCIDMFGQGKEPKEKMNFTYHLHNEWTKHPDGYVDIFAMAGFDYMVLEDVDDCGPDTCPA